jgi:hypothetical protein
MKKKLLITMGCSFTEGVGAYKNNISQLHEKGNLRNDFNGNIYRLNRPRFHKYAWGHQLQKKLNYDVHYNLGSAGSSDSFAAKRFVEMFHKTSLSEEYDVLVIWGLTFPERISFYKQGIIHSIMPGMKNTENFKKYTLGVSYTNFIDDRFFDPLLEQIFYVNVIKDLCTLYDFNFLYFSMFNIHHHTDGTQKNYTDFHIKYWPDDRYLNSYLPDINFWDSQKDIKISDEEMAVCDKIKRFLPTSEEMLRLNMLSPICTHPNEHGYKFLSERIFSIIEQRFPHYINNQEPEMFSNIYCGNSFIWGNVMPYNSEK